MALPVKKMNRSDLPGPGRLRPAKEVRLAPAIALEVSTKLELWKADHLSELAPCMRTIINLHPRVARHAINLNSKVKKGTL